MGEAGDKDKIHSLSGDRDTQTVRGKKDREREIHLKKSPNFLVSYPRLHLYFASGLPLGRAGVPRKSGIPSGHFVPVVPACPPSHLRLGAGARDARSQKLESGLGCAVGRGRTGQQQRRWGPPHPQPGPQPSRRPSPPGREPGPPVRSANFFLFAKTFLALAAGVPLSSRSPLTSLVCPSLAVPEDRARGSWKQERGVPGCPQDPQDPPSP